MAACFSLEQAGATNTGYPTKPGVGFGWNPVEMAMASASSTIDGGLLSRTSDRRDVSAPSVRRPFAKTGRASRPYFFCVTPKQRNEPLISEKSGIGCLRALCHRRRPDEKLVDFPPAAFRSLWKEVVVHLGLESFNYLPYSLRGEERPRHEI